ncbi:hypothetical protein VSDG_07941 [Cytospora chrysosperma]|uniref:Major facilitator superfamily (MFS) profile domain-containing protein n=1 Tax=Cytospora chrysosperma TaxID=252740 RepID=A0A423VKV0_CYTCH|nr:hypothetical protein VSDG_07941 [Valsa sordida]
MASVAENRTSETNAEASNSDMPDEKGQQPNGNNTNVSDAASEFPEGGRQAWLVVAGAWVSFFVSYGFISSAGVYQDYYQSTLLRDYSPSDISWIPSIQLFALSASAPFVGRIFDGHGPNVLVAVGTFLHIFGQMMQSLSTKYYQLLLSQAVCSGIGMGMMFHSSTASVATWFRLRRGLALGLASSGSGVGGVILPIMFENLVGQIGFPWTVRTIAFMLLAMQSFAIFAVRSRLQHSAKPFSLIAFLRPFKDLNFDLNVLGCFFGSLGMLLPFNFLKVSADAAGLPPSLTPYLLPILNAVSIIGRILPLWAGDFLGVFNMAIVFVLYGAILVLALWLPGAASTGAVIAFTVLYGIPLGFFGAAIPALVARISDIREIGVRIGMTFIMNGIAGLLGNPLSSLLIGVGHTTGARAYDGFKIFCGVAIVISAIFFVLARVRHGGWSIMKMV